MNDVFFPLCLFSGVVLTIVLVVLFFIIKNKIYDAPRFKQKQAEEELRKYKEKNRIPELESQIHLLQFKLDKYEKKEKDYYERVKKLRKEEKDFQLKSEAEWKKIDEEKGQLKKEYRSKYRFADLMDLYISDNLVDETKVNEALSLMTTHEYRIIHQLVELRVENDFLKASNSNLTAIPYMAQIVSDYETYGLERLARKLDWGENVQRDKKVKTIREIRKDAKEMVEKNLEARYQLAYLIQLFPKLQDIIDCEFKVLPPISMKELSDYDATKDYLTKEEYDSLSTVERNQLALDRYNDSHRKTKWQIGRDYEYFIGYTCECEGYEVEYYGSTMKLEDLGRDLICKKDKVTLIIQCKYWSQSKLIHEKHITQLFGSVASYCVENQIDKKIHTVRGMLVTNTKLSETAKKMAAYLEIDYSENVPMGKYPQIKCNIGRDNNGETKIYHLPFDQQYDVTKVNKEGEFMALTVEEAEAAGFRRAFKWFGD